MGLNLIDARERQPVKFGKYWVRIDGVRNAITLHEFDHYLDRGCIVEWVEEPADVFVPAKDKGDPYLFKQHTDDPAERLPRKPPPTKPEFLIDTKIEKKNLSATVVTISNSVPAKAKQARTRSAQKVVAVVASALQLNYGNEPSVKDSTYNNPECAIPLGDIFYASKFKRREEIITYLERHNRYPPNLPYLSLCDLRRLYPRLKGKPFVPEELKAELKWIFGTEGMKIINQKLQAVFKVRQIQKAS